MEMKNEELQMLEFLLRKFRDQAADRADFDKAESLRFDVQFECEAGRGIDLLPNAPAHRRGEAAYGEADGSACDSTKGETK